MLRRSIVIALLFAAISLCYLKSDWPTLLAQDGNPLLNRFGQEGPAAWKQYLVRTRRLQGSFRGVAVEVRTKKRTMEEAVELKRRPGCWLLMSQNLIASPKGNALGQIWVANSRYGFALRRTKPDAPWVTVGLDTDLSNGLSFTPAGAVMDGQETLNCPIDTPYVKAATLPELVVNPHFTATAVALPRGDRTLIKVQFAVSEPTSKNPGFLKGGWFVLDPDFMWVQREHQVEIEWRAGKVPDKHTIATTFDYREDAAPFPILARTVERRKVRGSAGDGIDEEWTQTFDLKEADVPARDFTLSAFGFPEPPGLGRPVPWYLWAGIAAIACLAVAAVLRWLGQRHQAAIGASK